MAVIFSYMFCTGYEYDFFVFVGKYYDVNYILKNVMFSRFLCSSFEPDVNYMLCARHPTPTQKLFCLHVFRQAGPPQRVDFLAPTFFRNFVQTNISAFV